MSLHKPPQQDAESLFPIMERSAGVTLLVLLLIATILNILFSPGAWFIVGNVLAGLIFYGCWRAVLADRLQLGLTLAFVMLFLFFLATESVSTFSLHEQIALVLAHIGIGLYAPIFCVRAMKTHEL